MTMDRIFTPWRLAYVTGETGKNEGCVFCDVQSSGDDAGNYVLHRGTHWYVMLNRYPYNNGHLLLVLQRHASLLGDCRSDELAELGSLLAVMERTLREALRPGGLNGGYNGGASAGAGIPQHLHLHLLPRWLGDTNFMSTVGETRVIPSTLDQMYAELQPVFAAELRRCR
jgi:ATP adenylyltransferase